jgi:CRISPR-associated endonuclease/helicase Cas3
MSAPIPNDQIVADAKLLSATLGLAPDESPFPWQKALLSEFVGGRIPRALDIPTGLGKTAVMAIWLVARLSNAQVPRRLVYVVDRRAVVDQATTVAIGLRQFVESNPDFKLRLGTLNGLPISTLRGQYVDNREWLENPASPAIIVGTVDMIGSRLLFEGYGVSRKMRPYHAGMLGADTLIVLDEAHLVPPFEKQNARAFDEAAITLRHGQE